jgi:signal transduction histidine kinase
LLDHLGLLPALIWQLERFSARTGVRVDFRHDGVEGRRFRGEIETAVFRIVQEALTNVARHARVEDATVYVWANSEIIGAQVKDSGVGFSQEVLAATASTGLHGMRERATLLGGQLTLESTPGVGTHVRVEIPLEEHPPHASGGAP